ncbi:gamma-glutamylcyclotransferase [Paenibacillus sp. PR3]|uniref:Gamma-glutamylcyclotransferase n=1 Tax=Paenibacillus terricola TaxID=2763503 RepID=A0ABR8MVX4_9BACL|nr:gamma-glutamylcyclotransferase family protein [Paenibacillus terricola]MBD3920120.1 gamma-glutamylcyclotransferase [Paenibacillus terricola]
MKTMIRVFIYGSLLPGEYNYHVVEHNVHHSHPGRVAGRLVDVGSYPALVRDASASQGAITTRGLWITVPLNALTSLDMLEDFYGWEEANDYDRIWVQDLDNHGVEGWVYVWDSDRGCPLVDASYWPDYYNSKQGRRRP